MGVVFCMLTRDPASQCGPPFRKSFNPHILHSLHLLQDDVHVMLPLVGEGGRGLTNSERFAAFGALLFAAISYPFSSQELVIDSEWGRMFFCGGWWCVWVGGWGAGQAGFLAVAVAGVPESIPLGCGGTGGGEGTCAQASRGAQHPFSNTRMLPATSIEPTAVLIIAVSIRCAADVWYAEFDAAAILYRLDRNGLLASYTGSQVVPELRCGPRGGVEWGGGRRGVEGEGWAVGLDCGQCYGFATARLPPGCFWPYCAAHPCSAFTCKSKPYPQASFHAPNHPQALWAPRGVPAAAPGPALPRFRTHRPAAPHPPAPQPGGGTVQGGTRGGLRG